MDVELANQLAQRRLYQLVDLHCQRRLEASLLTPQRSAEVAAAWVRIKSQQAMNSPAASQAAIWQELAKNRTIAGSPSPDGEFSLLVDVQYALAELLRGRLVRENAVGPLGVDAVAAERPQVASQLSEAMQHARQAILKLRKAAERTDQLLADAYQQRAMATAEVRWSIGELESLRRQLALKLVEAYREQAMCYPAQSSDYVNSLSQARESVQQIVSANDLEPEFQWRARLQQATLLRLLRQYDQAAQLLNVWLKENPSVNQRRQLLAEKIKLLTDQGLATQALSTAFDELTNAETNGVVSPEFDDALLAALIAARNQAADEMKDTLADRAGQLSRRIAALHGPYWHRRAEVRLGKALADAADSDDPALLLPAARSLYVGGRLDEAIDLYDRIYALHLGAGDAEAALEAAATAAAILEETGDLSAAIDRRISAASTATDLPKAPELHLAAAATVVRLIRQSTASDQQRHWQRYVTLLHNQIEQWPEAQPTSTARLWLARYEMSRNNWGEALQRLHEVAASSSAFDEAILASIACYHALLTELGSDDANSADQQVRLVAAATNRLHKVIANENNQLPQKWTPLQRRVAIELASMQLQHFAAVDQYTTRLLEALSANTEPADASNRRRVALLGIAAAARTGQHEQATTQIRELTLLPAEAVEFVRCLRLNQKLDDAAPPAALGRSALEALRSTSVQAVPQDRIKTNDETLLIELQHLEAEALAASGDRAGALAAFRALADADPADGQAALAVARLLASGGPDEQRQALTAYRAIEKRSKPGGVKWLQARRARISLLSAIGEQQQANKLLAATKVIYPGVDLGLSVDSAPVGNGEP